MKRRKPRNKHYFKFKLGGNRTATAPAIVRDATEQVKLLLREEHVKESMAAHGVGDTQNCSMAVCAKRQADAFSHPVEGYIDWQYSRAYVVSKTNKYGLPSECYVYRHNSDVAKLNDSLNGQKRLLAKLQQQGPMEIMLHPITKICRNRPDNTIRAGRPQGSETGERSSRAVSLRGPKARFAFARAQGAL